ncbi:RNA helicase [Malassezia nana]|uniref:RNA helicase n=1 Tax=Malassezia nana TaxID=180528 RepID=A0AAF0EGS8_9BASI|nr:RNA helicase [Malassezia nana]
MGASSVAEHAVGDKTSLKRDETPLSESWQAPTGPATMTRSSSQRNQPVKRYDGEPLSRTDVQHAVLCYLFSDTRRVFTNPRAGPRGAPMSTFVQAVANSEDVPLAANADPDRHALANSPRAIQACVASAVSGPFPTFVWPYGQSAGSARRADETDEEHAAWAARRTAYLEWRDATYPASITPQGEMDDAPASPWPHPGAEKLTFKELYIEALMNSSKCTKSMREKCFVDEEYAEDFSKVCLLVNVGRINTTLAFYPEMKTILRSYHPVPSLQQSENTRRNMQDAPRMKSLLKAVLLPHERPGGSGTASASARHEQGTDTLEVPGDLEELARRRRHQARPPTSVVTLIFLLANQASDVMSMHFPPHIDAHSLFFPQPGRPISAKHRANVFLWLLYHYLEGPASVPPGAPGSENPFDDDVSRAAREEAHRAWVSGGSIPLDDAHPTWRGVPNPEYARWREQHEQQLDNGDASSRKAPRKRGADGEDSSDLPPCPETHTHRLLIPALPLMAPEAYAREDADPPEEIAWGKQMQGERSAFLVRFEEEEQAKVLANGGVVDATDEERAKKRVHANTQSCYPLANILANAAAAGSNNGALNRSPIGFVKRARLSSRLSQTRDAFLGGDGAHAEGNSSSRSAASLANAHGESGHTNTPSLWDLDLTAAEADEQQTSLLNGQWQRIQRNTDYDSDSDAKHDDKDALARTLLVLRRVRESRGEAPS